MPAPVIPDLAHLIDHPPRVHRHHGTCCWVRKGKDEHGERWYEQIMALLGMTEAWPDKELAAALGKQGINAGRQTIYRHRAGACDCCRFGG